jgi:hypothetical protein
MEQENDDELANLTLNEPNSSSFEVEELSVRDISAYNIRRIQSDSSDDEDPTTSSHESKNLDNGFETEVSLIIDNEYQSLQELDDEFEFGEFNSSEQIDNNSIQQISNEINLVPINSPIDSINDEIHDFIDEKTFPTTIDLQLESPTKYVSIPPLSKGIRN